MCGITGIFNYHSGKPVNSSLLKRMCDTIVHRGPDDEGVFVNQEIGLGMRRLSIIDIGGGKQPMSNEDQSIWIVFNGEIYNFIELRDELESKGHVFKTRSDTETIVHAYEEWGVDALGKLNGMFGLALWDNREHKLILARDPFGVKPLYYWDNNNKVLFGSELKSILCDSDVVREVDYRSITQFLNFTFVPSPNTAFKNIKKLYPGHALIYTRTKKQLYRFHRVIPKMIANRSDADLIDELQYRIATAVERQMVADVPIGVMLSGGIDSSTVAKIMTELSDEPINTFTVGFHGNFKQNELASAREYSKQIGSHHYEIVISADEYAEFLPHAIWHLEEPVATASTLAFYKVCQLASEHVKVALTGQGADEPFAGYPRHLGEYYGSAYRTIPSTLRKKLFQSLIGFLPRNEQAKRAVIALDIIEPLERIASVYTILSPEIKLQLCKGNNMQFEVDYKDSIGKWQADVSHLDSLSQMLYIDSRFSLGDNLLMYGDKMAMAVSLEARVPFLDLDLMAFVESIPSSKKIKGLTQKYILKKAVAKWIPDNIIKRKKIGFTTPVDQWFRKDLGTTIRDQLLSPGSACLSYFNPEVILKMLTDHQSGRHDHKRILFSLLSFEIWHKQFISPSSWEY